MSESVLFWCDLESKSDDELCVESLVTHCKVKSVILELTDFRKVFVVEFKKLIMIT